MTEIKNSLFCNGIFKDITDQDYIEYMGQQLNDQGCVSRQKDQFCKIRRRNDLYQIKKLPFKRDSSWHFSNVSAEWGLDEPSFSNGAAYGDIDNDGDLDLIVNNVNMPAFVYRNESSVQLKNNSVTFSFKGIQKERLRPRCKSEVISRRPGLLL